MKKKTHATNRLLAAMPGTQRQLSRALGLSVASVSHWLIFMRNNGECHIGDWMRGDNNGPFVRVFYSGFGPDMICELKNEKPVPNPYGTGERGDHRFDTVRRDPMTIAFFGHGSA